MASISRKCSNKGCDVIHVVNFESDPTKTIARMKAAEKKLEALNAECTHPNLKQEL